MTANSSDAPYANLGPDQILDAVESLGLQSNGRQLALNSYENRVYQIGLEDQPAVIAKFYRPGRWSNEAILEEHSFAIQLAESDVPVIPPLKFNGQTLHHFNEYRFALFPRKGGRWPELDNKDNLQWLGRFIARIHAVGASDRFRHRRRLSVNDLGRDSLDYILNQDFIPGYMLENYRNTALEMLDRIETAFDTVTPVRQLRIHGDCHPGNILWTDNGPHFVDLDDCVTGPAIQDLWMLLSGEREHMEMQLRNIIEGYKEFYDFDPLELHLVEPLRALRIIHYSAWLARRWNDPAFPMHFPWFNTPRYWEEQLYTLREQIERMAQPVLQLEMRLY